MDACEENIAQLGDISLYKFDYYFKISTIPHQYEDKRQHSLSRLKTGVQIKSIFFFHSIKIITYIFIGNLKTMQVQYY